MGYHLSMSCTIHLTAKSIRGKLLSTANWKMMFMKSLLLIEQMKFPVGKVVPIVAYHGMIIIPWPIIILPVLTFE